MQKIKSLSICVCLMLLLTQWVSAQETMQLMVKPNKCISLHKGQTCYQKLKFRWSLKGEQEYCLVQVSNDEELVCWLGDALKSFEYDFASKTTESFQIRQRQGRQGLAEVKVSLAWVYRKNKKMSTGWRLF